MRALITSVIEVVGLAMVATAVGFQFGLWYGLGVGGAAMVTVGVTSS